jgi:hypothetical protein
MFAVVVAGPLGVRHRFWKRTRCPPLSPGASDMTIMGLLDARHRFPDST